MRNNYIVDVSTGCVKFLFKRLYDSYSCYMHIDHEFMDISCLPHII